MFTKMGHFKKILLTHDQKLNTFSLDFRTSNSCHASIEMCMCDILCLFSNLYHLL